MANTKHKKRAPIQPPSPSKPTSPSDHSHPPSSSQGLSGKLFGLLKKFPMPMGSPSKESAALDDQPDLYTSGSEEEEEEEEEEEDPLGDEQCRAIMENYLLETSTRTNLLRTRTLTHFCPALRRRLDFELSRITPTIAKVSAGDYHGRDGGVLRQTMEHVARRTIEQNGLQLGTKRSQSHQEQVWDEIEKSHHKRKRLMTNMTSSTSSKASKRHATRATDGGDEAQGTSSGGRRPTSRTKPPPSRLVPSGAEPTDLNPRLPSTPVLDERKPARPARRNESLISVNGSPVLTSGSQRLPDPPEGPFGGLGKAEFTFVERSKWKELEDKLKMLEMEEGERKKLDEMLRGCLKIG